MTTEELKLYVPDVYQKDIFVIDYKRLWEHGVRVISFDLDKTVGSFIANKAKIRAGIKLSYPEVKKLVDGLHEIGFKVAIITNAKSKQAKQSAEAIGADCFYAKADKPSDKCFKKVMKEYKINPSQMAHVGDSLTKDVAGGNDAGVITCKVKGKGKDAKAERALKWVTHVESHHWIREELAKNGMWREHHKKAYGDQYYQLGEKPGYLTDKPSPDEGSVAIFVDGKSPKKSAENLRDYISALGVRAFILDSKEEVGPFPGKVIVIGHHDFAREELKKVHCFYEKYGMFIGFRDNLCILMASRSALSSENGGEGHRAFGEYYNETLPEFSDIAENYGIPMTYEHNEKSTRRYQYDLIWLKFVKHSLALFLDIEGEEE